MWRLALLFTLGNAVILHFRIREEERALGPEWAQAFQGKGRFVP
jgi:methyltransferase